MRISHIGTVLMLVTVAAATATATASAESVPAPPPSAAGARHVDALSDYNDAIVTEQNDENSAAMSAGLAGAAVGVVPGCVFGAVTGLAFPPVEVVTVPVGCVSGAMLGAGVAAAFATSNVQSAEDPGIWQKCLKAMPAWACQIQQQQREQPADNDDD
jgi:hypothetical protein